MYQIWRKSSNALKRIRVIDAQPDGQTKKETNHVTTYKNKKR